MREKNIILKVDDLTVMANENNLALVDHVSFSVTEGKTLGIVGESGSGKSLTALSLTGLLPPGVSLSKGTALLQTTSSSLDLFSYNDKELKRIRGNLTGMVFQEPMTSLNPSMKCGLQAGEPLIIHDRMTIKLMKEKVIELFHEVQLPEPERIFNAYPHELSGGQRQRVMIAMALMKNPSLLIADEPTTALDVTVQKSILILLKELQEKYRMSMIFISHDLGVINEIAHETIVMKNGKTVEKGFTGKIMKSPVHAYTKNLLGCRPSLYSDKKRLPVPNDYASGNSTAESPESGEKKSIGDKPEKEILLTVRNLTKLFINQRDLLGRPLKINKAVNDVSFSVFRGETLGLVGESGCGKSTLGRLILRLINANGGEVIYNGTRVYNLKGKDLRLLRKKIQLVFQDPFSSLNPRMNIWQTLSEPLRIHFPSLDREEIKARIMEMLSKVSLGKDDVMKYPHQFSGGQRQRIVIARALITEPEFVICDESVSALDVSLQAQVLNLLNDLKEEMGLTYLFISHDLSVIRHMADRIIVMKEGSILESGETDELFEKPSSPYLKKLISSVPVIS